MALVAGPHHRNAAAMPMARNTTCAASGCAPAPPAPEAAEAARHVAEDQSSESGRPLEVVKSGSLCFASCCGMRLL